MEAIVIRRATMDDLKDLQKLGAELMEKGNEVDPLGVSGWYKTIEGTYYLSKRIRGKNSVCLVAEMGGNIVGYATGCLLPNQSWRPVKRSELDNLCVDKGFRGKSVGTHLVDAFFVWSKKRGVERVLVQAHAMDNDALRFYNKKGFKPFVLQLEAKM